MISARDLARRVAAGGLTPTAALEGCLEAIAREEPRIQAFVRLDPEGARRAAATAMGPLAGIGVAVKDIIDVAGMPTEMGSPIWADWRPRADAAVVSALRQAGAAILGKATTTAFAHLEPTSTQNPRAPGRTPGGSSSGSAAAVASGMAALALGTQTGGSIIRPASFCGVAGMKPSFRLVPTVGVKCFSWALDTVGLFGAGVEDVAFGLAAITGRPDILEKADGTATPSFVVIEQDFAGAPEQESAAALEEAVRGLARAGARVARGATAPILAEAFAAHPIVQDHEALRALAWEWRHHRDALPAVLREQLEAGTAITPAIYDAARRTAKHARAAARALLTDNFVLSFAAPGVAPEGPATGNARFNRLWTLLGVPCVAVPGLVDKRGLPVGIQVIGPFGRDGDTLCAAKFVEKAIETRMS